MIFSTAPPLTEAQITALLDALAIIPQLKSARSTSTAESYETVLTITGAGIYYGMGFKRNVGASTIRVKITIDGKAFIGANINDDDFHYHKRLFESTTGDILQETTTQENIDFAFKNSLLVEVVTGDAPTTILFQIVYAEL